MTQTSADAVVIGGGPNGLVAANLLADAGWEVVVLEAQPQIGGAVASDEGVRPGFVHDTFSSFYPLAAGSPTIGQLDLESYGLEWAHAPAVVGTPLPDGSWALLHRDPADTAAGLDELQPGDGDAWLEMCAVWERVGEQLVGALMSPFPPVRHGLGMALRLPRAGGLGLIRELLAPVRVVADQRFTGLAPKMLLAGNAAHADIPVDAPGSGAMGWLLVMLGQQVGFPVPRGGAGMLAQAMRTRLEKAGGRVETSTRAVRVEVRDGRATGVHVEGGERFEARRAVIADVSAPALYGGLVPAAELPGRLNRAMRRFQWDPGTVKVDWALSEPIPWHNQPSRAPGTVHLADSPGHLAHVSAQVADGVLPERPYLVLGQMAAADPTRAPAGAESVCAYTHVPHRPGEWSDLEQFADRMQDEIERHAPGFADHVLARRVLGPREMEQRNENLVGGALNGGTAGLHQQLVFRPVPGLGRAETPIKGLYLGSASAHPGGGVHGACGANAAQAALVHAAVRQIWNRS